jgi:hypothetical protein
MITITKAGSLIKIEHENGVSYVSQSDSPYFRLTDGNLTFRVGAVRIDEKDLSEFTIEGVVPTDEATLTTQLEAVFPNAGGAAETTWDGTQVEYDALGTYDENTTYYIHD